ncbi:MAG: porin family protein [Myxococcota bacterium]|jgi:hypothetical protein|nr:porin family protein [Myxococcota bacterium]
MRQRRFARFFSAFNIAIPLAVSVLSLTTAFAAQASHRDGEEDRAWQEERQRRLAHRDRHDRRDSALDLLGPYIGGAFSIGVEQFDNTIPGDDFDQGFGFDAWAGSRIHRHVGVEGQLSYLEGFEIEGTGIDFSHLNATANLKLYPLDAIVQPWILAGAGVGRFEREGPDGYTLADTGGVMRVGAGVDVYLNEHVSLVGGVGYLFTAGGIVDTDVVEMKFGLQYRF